MDSEPIGNPIMFLEKDKNTSSLGKSINYNQIEKVLTRRITNNNNLTINYSKELKSAFGKLKMS